MLLVFLQVARAQECPERLDPDTFSARVSALKEPVAFADPSVAEEITALEGLVVCVDGPTYPYDLQNLHQARGAFELLVNADAAASNAALTRALSVGATADPDYGPDIEAAFTALPPPGAGQIDLQWSSDPYVLVVDGGVSYTYGEQPLGQGWHLIQWMNDEGWHSEVVMVSGTKVPKVGDGAAVAVVEPEPETTKKDKRDKRDKKQPEPEVVEPEVVEPEVVEPEPEPEVVEPEPEPEVVEPEPEPEVVEPEPEPEVVEPEPEPEVVEPEPEPEVVEPEPEPEVVEPEPIVEPEPEPDVPSLVIEEPRKERDVSFGLGVMPRYAIVRSTLPDGSVVHVGTSGQPGIEVYGTLGGARTGVVADLQLGPTSAQGRPSVLNRGQLSLNRAWTAGNVGIVPHVGLELRPLPMASFSGELPDFTSQLAPGGFAGVRIGGPRVSVAGRLHGLSGARGVQGWVAWQGFERVTPVLELETLKVADARYTFVVAELEWSLSL